MNDYMFLMQIKRDKERYYEMLRRYREKKADKIVDAIKKLIDSIDILIEKTEIELGLKN